MDREFPEDQAAPEEGNNEGQSICRAVPPPSLSASEISRLDSYMPDIAVEKLNHCREVAAGCWRAGEKDPLSIHPGGTFHDFRSGTSGRGGFALIKHLHGFDDVVAVVWARKWLREHQGTGRLTHSVSADEDSVKALDDAARTAFIHEVWNHASPITGTPADTYLESRGLAPAAEDSARLRWLGDTRGEEGAMLVVFTDNAGAIVALQETFMTAAGEKSAHPPVRQLHRGPHDWGRRGLVRFGRADAKGMVICEGVEDALSARAAGAELAVAFGGIARLGRVTLPPNAESVVGARADDPNGSAADLSLWRGCVRLLGQGVKVSITARPTLVVGNGAPQLKDINDLLRHDPALVKEFLASAVMKPVGSSEEAVSAIVDEASRLDRNAYENGRKRIAVDLLGWSRVKALDDARRNRIDERAMTTGQKTRAPQDEPWDDPVLDIGAVLDEIVAEVRRYVVAPLHCHHTVALWSVWAHIVHREDLELMFSPRLAIQSPTKRCGKTTYLKIVTCLVPRPQPTGSLTPSSLFRAVDARKVTLLIDEADNIIHRNVNPDLLAIFNSGHDRVMSKVTRSVPNSSGGYDDREFQTFTGIALTSIKQFPDTAQDRCIVLRMKRATPVERPEYLINGRSPLLIDCRRKIARWVADLRELPQTTRPTSLINRTGDNWYGLLQVAELAGGDWPARALAAALASEADGEDTDELVALLEEIWQIFFARDVVRMHTEDLVTALREVDEGRWKGVNHGRGVDEYYLREALKDVLPKTEEAGRAREWRGAKGPRKGYAEIHLEDAWRRYLGKEPPSKARPDPRTSATSATRDEKQDSSMTSAVAEAEAAIRDSHGIGDTAEDNFEGRGSQDDARQASATETILSGPAVRSNVADVADVADSIESLLPAIPRGASSRRRNGNPQETQT